MVPIALNSGLYWGRRAFLKRPGTVLVQIMPPIPAGLDRRKVMARLEQDIETTPMRCSPRAVGTSLWKTLWISWLLAAERLGPPMELV
jgi:1-acyl-sn-glycerol-3-phosphate acyltransferase